MARSVMLTSSRQAASEHIVQSVCRRAVCELRRSGGPAVQQPDGGAERGGGERHEDAGLDELEVPEPVGGLVREHVLGSLRVAADAEYPVPDAAGGRRYGGDSRAAVLAAFYA